MGTLRTGANDRSGHALPANSRRSAPTQAGLLANDPPVQRAPATINRWVRPLQRTWNPSRSAAVASRMSLLTNSRLAGSSSAAVRAAANCRASAPRRACTRRSRNARRRTRSVGGTSSHTSLRFCKDSWDWLSVPASRRPSRRSRLSADAHSTRLPHQVTMRPSCRSNACRSALVVSFTRRATRAEESQ